MKDKVYLEEPGHVYYEGPGSVQVPGRESRPVEKEEILDITNAAEGTVVHGGTLREIAPRGGSTHLFWLDPEECIALKRSPRGPLEPIAQQKVHRAINR